MLFTKKWNPKGLHCFVTGGSQGLGLELAKLLTSRGADVSIVARNQARLDAALAELEVLRQSPNQILKAYSFSLTNYEGSVAALEAVTAPHGGRCPDAVFMVAGASRPAFFVEESEDTLRNGFDNAYWIQAWTALAATKRMVKDGVKGKLTFVSSTLGYMSIVGYSSYSPGKHALRGLAETLRSELILYGISVHIMFPGTIFSPGYEKENLTKPKITLKIEETDGGGTPEAWAQGLFQGIEKNHFHITPDLMNNIFRSSTRGSTPRNNIFLDTLYGFIGWIGLPIWRMTVDSTVRGHIPEHQDYLRSKGIIFSPKVSKP
ncbi:NAD(P)-binding protein [Fistulina hepatica ATCC 64428]|nr:NAD(P)-binding protein [Fistulina hepatica ATCC 64428]